MYHASSQDALQAEARARAFSLPIEQIDPANPQLFMNDTVGHYFERLRRDDPVHHSGNELSGSYWSVTRYNDIMYVDTHHELFSSDWRQGGITVIDPPPGESFQMFIAMDPPQHDVQRKTVQPVVGPGNLAHFQTLIRERTAGVLDALPRGEVFNWVDLVSVELTSMMLATLFDFPLEERRRLPYWSDVATSNKKFNPAALDPDDRMKELGRMLERFSELWRERAAQPPRPDLISMLAHGEETRNMSPAELMGNLVLLIVGGNDTTRNSMSGGLLALHDNPAEWDKLRANPALVDSLASEIIRWQTPLAHMRRTALVDTELGGKTIRKGEKVVMWYLSGNRDESVIAQADRFIIDRPKVRQHLAFGFGIHRCLGSRLAELQLRILWEEILKRFPVIEVVGTPQRVPSAFVRGITHLPVRIPA